MLKFVATSLSRVQRHIAKPWYAFLVAALAALDLFVLVIPSDGLLISAVLARPKTWKRSFILISLGSAFGALVLGLIVQAGLSDLLYQWLPAVSEMPAWETTTEFVKLHGWWALSLISLSPLPQQPGVVVSALADMPVPAITTAVLVGRLLKYGLLAWLASHAPRYLTRIWGIRGELEDLQQIRRNQVQQNS